MAICALYRFRKVGRGCLFATLYIPPFSSALSRFNCVMDNYTTHHLKRLYGRLFTYCLMIWCIPCTWPGDRTSVTATTVVVSPAQSCARLPGRDAVTRFLRWCNRSNHVLVRVWPVSAVKKQSCVLMVGMLSRCTFSYACSLPCDVRNCGHGH